MSELKATTPRALVMTGRHNEPIYIKSEADKVIAELNEKVSEERSAKVDYMISANDLSNGLADAYDEIRMLRRTLWLARAEWARSSALSYHLIESHPDKDVAATYKRKANKWEKVKDKCLKKAEEYK